MSVSSPTPPTVILGAARSGTKILRALIAAGGFAPVPYDVNYIWRYRQQDHPDDVLAPESATAHRILTIRRMLRKAAGVSRQDNRPIVEKTVSSILRVPFLLRIFPEARFVYLVRDGRDVTESAFRSWTEPTDAGYVLDKLRTFPLRRCGKYLWRRGSSVIRQKLGISEHHPGWGPRYVGMDADIAERSLLEVCAIQWARCVEQYTADRHLIPPRQLCELRYEDLIRQTEPTVERLAEFLGQTDPTPLQHFAKQSLRQDRIGSASRLNAEQLQIVDAVTSPMRTRWGYAGSGAGSESVKAA